MKGIMQEKLLPRSKSTGYLDTLDNEYDYKRFSGRCRREQSQASTISVDAFACDGSYSSREEVKLDSGIKSYIDDESLFMLEQKIGKLAELLQEQHKLLMSIKDKISSAKAETDWQDTASKIVKTEYSTDKEEEFLTKESITRSAVYDGAPRAGAAQGPQLAGSGHGDQLASLDDIVRDALENFLQSNAVQSSVAGGARRAVRGAVGGALAAGYVPLVGRAHCLLVRRVAGMLDRAFFDLEESTASLFKTIHRASSSMRASLERHQHILNTTTNNALIKVQDLRATFKKVLEEELKLWREKVLQELSSPVLSDCQDLPFVECSPPSPMQPTNPNSSPIDTLMECALINKLASEGDAAGAFAAALGARDLALVMAACRAAPHAALPVPLRLALLRQLAADMVHDTQLKCRYLEESIISLSEGDAAGRAGLPEALGEARAHLTRFLRAYPKHHAAPRVALIVMAADSMLM